MKNKIIVREVKGIKIKCYEDETLTDKKHQEKIQNWIKSNLINTINKKHTSYGIKHACEKKLGFYVSNYDIKYNMAILGIKGVEEGMFSVNYFYPISENVFK